MSLTSDPSVIFLCAFWKLDHRATGNLEIVFADLFEG